eukprot:1186421-Rhodomonas_salina.1
MDTSAAQTEKRRDMSMRETRKNKTGEFSLRGGLGAEYFFLGCETRVGMRCVKWNQSQTARRECVGSA